MGHKWGKKSDKGKFLMFKRIFKKMKKKKQGSGGGAWCEADYGQRKFCRELRD